MRVEYVAHASLDLGAVLRIIRMGLRNEEEGMLAFFT